MSLVRVSTLSAASLVLFLTLTTAASAAPFDYRLLSTTKTSTMEKEMNEAADSGFLFASVMGGDVATGGKEVVVVMQKDAATTATKRLYKLLATSKTSTMQKEIQALGDEGFAYLGQSVFQSAFGGKEVVVILERDPSLPVTRIEYQLLATTRSSTMQKELREAGESGFAVAGMTVAKTSFGGPEIVTILRK
jgi:hypothetical protein